MAIDNNHEKTILKFLLPILLLTLTGCVAPNILPPASSPHQSKVNISVKGLQSPSMYPDDAAWLNIYDGAYYEDKKSIAQYRFTPKITNTAFPIDSGKEYTFKIYTVESTFGGYNSCTVAFKTKPLVDVTYSVDFQTFNANCFADITTIDISGNSSSAKSIKGASGGGVHFQIVN